MKIKAFQGVYVAVAEPVISTVKVNSINNGDDVDLDPYVAKS